MLVRPRRAVVRGAISPFDHARCAVVLHSPCTFYATRRRTRAVAIRREGKEAAVVEGCPACHGCFCQLPRGQPGVRTAGTSAATTLSPPAAPPPRAARRATCLRLFLSLSPSLIPRRCQRVSFRLRDEAACCQDGRGRPSRCVAISLARRGAAREWRGPKVQNATSSLAQAVPCLVREVPSTCVPCPLVCSTWAGPAVSRLYVFGPQYGQTDMAFMRDHHTAAFLLVFLYGEISHKKKITLKHASSQAV